MINVDFSLYAVGKLAVACTLDVLETIEARLFVALIDIDELVPELSVSNRRSLERKRVLDHRASLLAEDMRRAGAVINYVYSCGRKENEGVY